MPEINEIHDCSRTPSIPNSYVIYLESGWHWRIPNREIGSQMFLVKRCPFCGKRPGEDDD